ncbi:1,4-alpha-glucan branching protein GlgB [Planctomyces sp. SH-PL14]|uniref:1,4-alpha-glucan branching protein GlgB n=1 Tax=Planctomyces sp. SH-PL14 TaxID=1632864 RepID=UPI00078D8621|nr:1,4-alpha-glucan branching protein GlgB [Planctomyces sp. SH-PL14]AMV19244.1 1,4-alpha-glucan branching enzyme GlgB [Planctomyces sp. SH-PL14]
MSWQIWSDFDSHLWAEGTHMRAYEKLGAHPETVDGQPSCRFAVWAPNASNVSVIGDFNGWQPGRDELQPVLGSGVWQGLLPRVRTGALYKFHIVSRHGDFRVDKADPFAFQAELPPGTASRVCETGQFEWHDAEWRQSRGLRQAPTAPISIYEVHLGSWRRGPQGETLTYRQLAPLLADYIHEMGFTHVELMPLGEHPFGGSWGYQTIGYFAPTSRYGAPDDLRTLIDLLHQRGIGVLLDWVPAHFPRDEHGLAYFDGTHLFEASDPQRRSQPDWNTFIFDYGKPEVVSFLTSSALFWLDQFHIDGLRVDAVASMLYLDYSREPGEWTPNRQGGRENLEAIEFLRHLNRQVSQHHPGTLVIAEESTAFSGVSRSVEQGGLGFSYKWDMGWMHDTLRYAAVQPAARREHHSELTFRMNYAFSERFVLPLSHDEVVYGKGSLLSRMPGDDWQKRAHLRLLFGYLFTQPGKKLLFMGGELGQWDEWNHDATVCWELLNSPEHRGLQRWVRDLNTFYRGQTALHALDTEPGGFEWIEAHDAARSIIGYLRRPSHGDPLLVLLNWTAATVRNYRIGVPTGGDWTELLNSDAALYGGSGQGNLGTVHAAPVPAQGRPYLLSVTVPPLALTIFRPTGERPWGPSGFRSDPPSEPSVPRHES